MGGGRPIRKAAGDHGDAARPLRARKTDLAGGVHGSAAAGARGGCGGRRRQAGPGLRESDARAVSWEAGRRARLVSERECICGLSGVRAVRERAGSGAKARRGRGLWAS